MLQVAVFQFCIWSDRAFSTILQCAQSHQLSLGVMWSQNGIYLCKVLFSPYLLLVLVPQISPQEERWVNFLNRRNFLCKWTKDLCGLCALRETHSSFFNKQSIVLL